MRGSKIFSQEGGGGPASNQGLVTKFYHSKARVQAGI